MDREEAVRSELPPPEFIAERWGQRKIFGIGLPRTGTTSLVHALNVLGFPSRHACHFTEHFDSAVGFTDTPLWSDYREIDARFPGSCFIHTTREVEGWLDSLEKSHVVRFFNRYVSDAKRSARDEVNHRCYTRVFGTDEYDRDRFREAFAQHTEGVREFFESRNELLVLDLADDANMRKLVNFLHEHGFVASFPSLHRDGRFQAYSIAKADEI